MSNPALMNKDQLRTTLMELAFKPGLHKVTCESYRDAVNLRLRMNKIRSTERKKEVKDRIERDPKFGHHQGDGFIMDRLVFTIERDSPVVLVNVAPEHMPLDFITTVQPDGSEVPTFPSAPATGPDVEDLWP